MNNAFLYICTLTALFITVSGITAAQHPSQLAFHILFFPVTFYLLIAAASQLSNPHKAIAAPLTTHITTAMSLVFILLIIIVAKVISILMTPV